MRRRTLDRLIDALDEAAGVAEAQQRLIDDLRVKIKMQSDRFSVLSARVTELEAKEAARTRPDRLGPMDGEGL